jgi:hypothetical protein
MPASPAAQASASPALIIEFDTFLKALAFTFNDTHAIRDTSLPPAWPAASAIAWRESTA